MPLISVIILTLNSKDFISRCLDSIFRQARQDLEIIVVDNGSKDGTCDFLRNKYPKVLVIRNEDNLGACRARNQGIKAAKGSWVFSLDCDVILSEGFISGLFRAIENPAPNLGMIQAKILQADRKTIYSCGIYISKLLLRFYDIGKGLNDQGQFDNDRRIFGACSAAAVYNRKMLEALKEKTGYFDERFFFLFEDVDLAWRSQRSGWKTLFEPGLVCYHEGNSSGTCRKIRQYLCLRNRYLTLFKNRGLNWYFLPLFFYDIPRILYILISNRIFYDKINSQNYRFF
ncbi:MAG: glycosyltransferase family 2 protein [Candidatus Omnitrophica bacterium]|nr:glycosyltransferase family 2 protein [Candidatus Omnitrophota bacterium]MDD5027085.1 glycosyltransferase family 2 protein [Candidatus Omnitrophota bacterium]MDD5662098.1 glycosyltransferase family 2 protein [Candidatus Omnitrophota bacterium]